MSEAYVGIDPGLTGAIAILYSDGIGDCIYDVPTYTNGAGKREYDFYNMYVLLGDVSMIAPTYVTLEQQQAMPGQGVSSTFKTGGGYYAWRALCTITTPNFKIVSPRKWKKRLGLTSDKEKSRALAIKLYPGLVHTMSRVKDHNRAEALLLAHYTKLERNK